MKFNVILTPKEAIICYLEGLEKVNQIKSKPKAVIKEIEVHV